MTFDGGRGGGDHGGRGSGNYCVAQLVDTGHGAHGGRGGREDATASSSTESLTAQVEVASGSFSYRALLHSFGLDPPLGVLQLRVGPSPRRAVGPSEGDVFKRKLIMAQMLHLGNSHKKLAQSAFQ